MSLSKKNVELIRKLEEAVGAAQRANSEIVREHAESMMANLTASSAGADTERVVAQYKTLSNITQGLSAVQSQLKSIAAMALEFGNSASEAVLVKPIRRRKSLDAAAAVDVVSRVVKSKKSVKTGSGRGRKPAPAGTLTSNDNKLLAFLQATLKSGAPTAITGEALATGSGLPKGSLGVSMKKLISLGAVKSAGRGMFQIDETATPGAPAPMLPAAVPNAKPGRKPKAAVSKPEKIVKAVKAKAVKAAKPAKAAKAIGESKATPAKKIKKTAATAKKVSAAKAVSVSNGKSKSAAKTAVVQNKAKAEVAPTKTVRAKANNSYVAPNKAVKAAVPATSDVSAVVKDEAAVV